MHNIHLVVVKANSHEDAESLVENAIQDWGTENNWRTICGSVSESNTWHNVNDGRWDIDETTTIESINDMVRGWINDIPLGSILFDELLIGKKKKDDLSFADWYSIKKYAAHMQESTRKKDFGKTFDVFLDEFFEWELDKCGVTNLYYDGKIRYVVFIDMHS